MPCHHPNAGAGQLEYIDDWRHLI
jgi:hypothetical protein